jgi:hypothetical protein
VTKGDGWVAAVPDAGQQVWTDDYSNVLGAVWRRLHGVM